MFGLAVTCQLGRLHPTVERLGLTPSSNLHSHFLLMHTLGTSWCRLKWLGPCIQLEELYRAQNLSISTAQLQQL